MRVRLFPRAPPLLTARERQLAAPLRPLRRAAREHGRPPAVAAARRAIGAAHAARLTRNLHS
jgi:hypothetical protein